MPAGRDRHDGRPYRRRARARGRAQAVGAARRRPADRRGARRRPRRHRRVSARPDDRAAARSRHHRAGARVRRARRAGGDQRRDRADAARRSGAEHAGRLLGAGRVRLSLPVAGPCTDGGDARESCVATRACRLLHESVRRAHRRPGFS
ncbi:hypothetical protein F01_260088 [Burkholderia cenocepacia]|nr:hypothetical protein F01_260088 [Burkholderia cenocepacia]